jgi:hypothetical protein
MQSLRPVRRVAELGSFVMTTRRVLIVGACLAILLLAVVAAERSFGPFGFDSRHQHTECITNLRQLDGAKTAFALEHGKTNGEPVTMADLVPYFRSAHLSYGDTCPFGGHYELRLIGLTPICSLGTNRVSWHREGWLLQFYTYHSDSGNMYRLP